MDSLLSGLSGHMVMLSPSLRAAGVNGEAELSTAGLAFVLFYLPTELCGLASSQCGSATESFLYLTTSALL